MGKKKESPRLEASDEIPDSGELIHLSAEDQRRIAEAILNPPEPTEALVRAFKRHAQHIWGQNK